MNGALEALREVDLTAVVFGEPILVPRDAERDVIESKRRELEAALNRVSGEATRVTGKSHVPAV